MNSNLEAFCTSANVRHTLQKWRECTFKSGQLEQFIDCVFQSKKKSQ